MADLTTGDLFKLKTITDDEVNAAVEVFMRDPTVTLFRFASGHTLDPVAAVKASNFARLVVTDVHASCLIPGFDGAIFTSEWRDALWARFFTAAPRRRRRSVERSSIVKRA